MSATIVYETPLMRASELRALLDGIPPNCFVVVDDGKPVLRVIFARPGTSAPTLILRTEFNAP